MTTPGQNYVELVGLLKQPNSRPTRNGNLSFQAKIAIPYMYNDRQTGQQVERFKYIKISAWNEVAENLGAYPEDTLLKVHGSINERSYDGACKTCNAPEKKYWTDVVVDTVVPV